MSLRMGMILAAALAAAWSQIADAATDRRRSIEPEAISDADFTRTGMRGTGCAWMPRRTGKVLFVAMGDRALIKLGGILRKLRPAPGAAEAFPFTHDNWVGDGVRIDISRRGSTSSRGEANIQPAVMQADLRGSRYRRVGVIDCGT